jgi:N-acetyl-gamma-glutamylphosphate reductase
MAGTTGAGRAPKEAFLYCEVADGIAAYAVGSHRHAPEIEQQLTAVVVCMCMRDLYIYIFMYIYIHIYVYIYTYHAPEIEQQLTAVVVYIYV